ncbi:MAG: tetratricopeptide repeat protein [Anaerolineae bacterium]
MSDRVTPGELERLECYMPPGWRERVELPLSPDGLADCVSHLQALLSTVGTYLPRAVLVDDREVQIGRGAFRYGTVLFADVSGFSALTERFSQEHGREGAEEITLIVNRFLEVVNGVAVAYGGDLLKFAGDAALSFYQGEEHAARACRAAWEMQQAMRERFAHVETSLGHFPLRMSIGLGSGDALMVSLGTSDHAEYTVMGPALATAGQAEHLAQAGQIFVARTTRELAGADLTVTPGGEEGFFELRRAEPRPRAVERPDLRLAPPDLPPHATLRWLLARLDDLVPYLSPGLLEKLVSSPQEVGVESDHRWVTTAFADLRGANSLVEALGAERGDLLTEVVNRHFLAMRGVVERYEGVLHKVGAGPSGPHLFITFGAPKSHADDPERAVRAALEMRDALAEVNQEVEALVGEVPGLQRPLFRQAIGITTGFVFAGSIGSSRRWEYTVMGDLVNLAARLMAAAAEGEILVADSTARYLGKRFELRPRPVIHVKGKREPVSHAQVAGLVQLPPLLGVAEGRVVGRQAELETAQGLLDRAIQGAGGVLTVCGEAGMGKSRLAQEIAQQAHRHGVRVLAGACLSYGGDIPYLPWADVLRALLGISATDKAIQVRQLARGLAAAGMAGWEPLVAEPLDLDADETELTASLDPRLRQQRLFDIVLELIRHHAQTQPLLLVLEDVHWADPTSLELLDYVARNVASCPAVVLILHRPREWLDDRWWTFEHAAEIVLQELPGTAVRALIADLLGVEEVPDQLIAPVLRKAQGNPFFTEEVVRALIDAELLRRDNGRWALVADPDQAGVPDTIHGVIQSRIDRLEETDRRVLQVAAVIGRVFSMQVLGGVYPYDDLDGTLQRRMGRLGTLGLVLLEMPGPEPVYMFRHALTQDVAYESLPYARRRELHRRVGAFIETQGREALSERPGFLAHHFFHGQSWFKALNYSLMAGRKAQREYANEAAIAHFERALQAATEVDEPCEEERLDAHEAVSEVLAIVGRYDEALGHLEQARTIVETQPPSPEQDRRRAELYRETADVCEAKGDYGLALKWLRRGLNIPGIAEALEGAGLYLMGGGVFYRLGSHSDAIEWCRRGLDIATAWDGDSRQNVLARGNRIMGLILQSLGKIDEAIEYCLRSLTLCQERGDLLGQVKAHNNLAMAYHDRDSWARAIEHYVAAMRLAEQIGYAEGQAEVATNLGEVYRTQGRLEEAREAYRSALRIAEQRGIMFGVALLHNNLGATYVRDGRWDRAEEYLERSQALFEEIGSERFMAELHRHKAEVALGRGDVDQALDGALRSLEYAQTPQEEGPTWRVLGRIWRERGELDQAEDGLERALVLATEMENRYETALTHLELGRLRLQRGDKVAGRDLARQAMQVFEELGAQLDLEEAERLLENCTGREKE